MYYKILLFIVCAFLLNGCVFQKEQVKPAPPVAIKKPPIKSAIKGIITELAYVDGRYCYKITSTDTTNAKLPKAEFCSVKFYHNKGDLVYATLIDDSLENMMLIREAKESTPVVKSGSKKNIKTKISVPKEESISF
ncbi:hypothetical protein [Campylobacter suis]|uniref:Lipoprotein n=1 Tax=Campylobacter suis TaxID=2790657 RepID=A0ABN7K9F0_9BACT|nr:hypothetical protein [Campylobacter suis]CAD7289149.1 hypothetical protein LMG8286_01675 [Campylobacter suis]